MGTVYKQVGPDGRIEYTDTPRGSGDVTTIGSNGAKSSPDTASQDDYGRAKKLIKEAQKRIPKIDDYLNYLDYLRHNSPIRFERVMQELKMQDPQTWIKLQKFPQFRPLRETAIGLKAGSNIMGASAGLAGGNFTGSTEKWMESTLNDLMKRDRFGPYADVLGSKATTLPTKVESYSSSRLGQYLKTENAAAAVASGNAAKEMASAQAGLRAAKGAAAVRVAGPILDFGIAVLNPDTAVATTNTVMRLRLERLALKNPRISLDTEEYETARRLLSQSKYGELDQFLKRFE